MKWICKGASAAERVAGYEWAVETATSPDDNMPPVVCCLARNKSTADAITAALNIVIQAGGIHRLETLVRLADMEANGDRRP